MHRRERFALAALFGLAIVASIQYLSSPALAQPSVVIDDRLDLGIPISTVALDSSLFAEKTLLVGTDTNPSGSSFVIRVSNPPMSVVDTLAVLSSRVRIIRTALLNADSIPDLLIGLDTAIVRILRGGVESVDTIPMHVEVPITSFGEIVDTITVTGDLRDIEVDHTNHAFWVGLQTSAWLNPWPAERVATTVGALLRFTSLGTVGHNLSRWKSYWDLRIEQGTDGTASSVITFWFFGYSSDIAGTNDDHRLASSGSNVYSASGDSISGVLLSQARSTEGSAYTSFVTPVAVADLTGDSVLEYVHACFTSSWWPVGDVYESEAWTRAYTVGSDTPLWSLDGKWPASIWELTGDSIQDVLLFGDSELRGIHGPSGAHLFSVPMEYSLFPQVTGSLDATGRPSAVIFRADTLIVYHLSGDGFDKANRPVTLTLHSNFPNPFNQGTTISFSTSDVGLPARMRLSIHNILGHRVRSFGERPYSKGDYQILWDGRDDQGKPVPSGVYFVMLRSGDDVQAQKMMLLK